MDDGERFTLLWDIITEALESSEIGQQMQICRDFGRCQATELCSCCALVTKLEGMTVMDVMQAAKAYRA